jgi:hypothetical protein
MFAVLCGAREVQKAVRSADRKASRQRIPHSQDAASRRHPRSPLARFPLRSERSFACSACGLKLQGYSELDAAALGGSYTRTTYYSPEEYYGLVDPSDINEEAIIQQYLDDMAAHAAYDNE